MYPCLHVLALLLLDRFTVASFSSRSPEFPSTQTPSTCPLRTANYITHALPQQCLTSSRETTSLATTTPTTGGTVQQSVLSGVPKEASNEPNADFRSLNTSTTFVASTTPDDTTATTTLTPIVIPTLSVSSGPVPQSPVSSEVAAVAEVLEEDSALESGNFLSFEEWKKQNLKKAGQSEHIGRKGQASSQEPRKRPERLHNSLESLGDDGEIDIDFSGFVSAGPEAAARELSQPVDGSSAGGDSAVKDTPKPVARSKDAGTTCKERFNYASFDCAANVLKTNKEARSPNTVLVENKDSYMLNKCAAQNKFLILELCNEILIDTVVLANFEFFSSTFRTFRVSVSDRYPVKVDKWKTLGTYEARNSREVQAFLVENPLIWTRYVRIEFLSQYGSEFYCPVSLVRIHGTTMMEDYKHDLALAMGDESDDDESALQDEGTMDSLTPEAIAEPLKTSTSIEPLAMADTTVETNVIPEPASVPNADEHNAEASRNASSVVPPSIVAMEAIMSVIESFDTCSPTESSTDTSSSHAVSTQVPASNTRTSTHDPSTTTPVMNVPVGNSPTTSVVNKTTTTQSSSLVTAINSLELDHINIMSEASPGTSNSPTSIGNTSRATNTTVVSNTTFASNMKAKSSTTASDRPKSSGTTGQSHPSVPPTQDSFFKSVQKRLQMLEANSSMSLQYIEDQSRALRDAFKKVEQRQLARTSTFLDQLNYTVLNELREFRQQYDQLWQSTVIELGLQRERYERDNEAINARIGVLADEVVFQRRMAILQMILILVCLILVLFSKGTFNNYLELPIVQNVLAKSPNSRWLNLSGDASSRPAPPARIRSAQQSGAQRTGILKSHRRMLSEDSITDPQSSTEIYAPPTPISDYERSEVGPTSEDRRTLPFESDKDEALFDDPEFDPSTIERPATSPPSLRLNDASVIPDILESSEEGSPDALVHNEPNASLKIDPLS